MFNDYRPLARNIASYYSRRYNRTYDEVLDHAEFALALLVCGEGSYDPVKGSVRAWLQFKIQMHLKDVYLRGYHPHCEDVREAIKSGHREIPHSDVLEMMDDTVGLVPASIKPIKSNWISRLYNEISEEAGALLEIICDAPSDLLEEIGFKPGRTDEYRRHKLINYLVDVLDWSWIKVAYAFDELERSMSA